MFCAPRNIGALNIHQGIRILYDTLLVHAPVRGVFLVQPLTMCGALAANGSGEAGTRGRMLAMWRARQQGKAGQRELSWQRCPARPPLSAASLHRIQDTSVHVCTGFC